MNTKLSQTPQQQQQQQQQPHPSLSYLPAKPPLKGQTLYLGGDEGPDGMIYCIPGHAPRVLMINPNTDECIQIGPEFSGKFKWLRSVLGWNNIIYGIPCHADTVLRIDATVNPAVITTIPIEYDSFFNNQQNNDGNDIIDNNNYKQDSETERLMEWKYHGATTSPIDKCIYAIPQSATRVLRIDPATDRCTLVGPKLEGRWKWYGGNLGKKDDAIYGIPHNSSSVLRIKPYFVQEPSTGGQSNVVKVSVTLHGDLGDDHHKWHGAGVSTDGTIVGVPANSSQVLLIKPNANSDEPDIHVIGDENCVATGPNAGRVDRKYKYMGSMSDKANNVYCIPAGTERVLRVNTTSHTLSEIGPSLYESGLEEIKQNKWQNGFYSNVDKSMYAVPLAANTVLRVDVSNQEEPSVSTMRLPLDPPGNLAKWEGGVMAKNGNMYCMPNCFKHVLKIEPSR